MAQSFCRIGRNSSVADLLRSNVANNTETIELSFGRKWLFISAIRSFIQSFLRAAVKENHADLVSMSVSELAEIFLKYSAAEETNLKITLNESQSKAEVAIHNHTSESHAEDLTDFIKKLNTQNPLEIYMNRMEQSNESDKGHLSLARIRYEAEADLNTVFNNPDFTVTAVFDFDKMNRQHF
jgi:hypothetical protein